MCEYTPDWKQEAKAARRETLRVRAEAEVAVAELVAKVESTTRDLEREMVKVERLRELVFQGMGLLLKYAGDLRREDIAWWRDRVRELREEGETPAEDHGEGEG